ncbi:Pyruvate dehydrogenase E1 component [Streptomyces misionensis JCM 4497]
MAAMPAQTTAAGPKRRARRGAVTPKTAKQSGGTEVSSPATLPLMPSPSRTSSRRAPRLVMAGRRLSADSTMPAVTRRITQGRGAPGFGGVSGALGVADVSRSIGDIAVRVSAARVSSLAMGPIIES